MSQGDGTIWHFSKYLCSTLQDQIEEYFTQQVRVFRFRRRLVRASVNCADDCVISLENSRTSNSRIVDAAFRDALRCRAIVIAARTADRRS